MNAKIVNNFPYCPICNEILGNSTGNYKLVQHNDEKLVEFERFCNGKCKGKYKYYSDLSFNKRYSFNDDEVVEVNPINE